MRIMRVFPKGRLFGAMAASLLVGAPALGQELGQEWTALTAENAKIVFQVPSLDDKIVRRMYTKDKNHKYTLEVAFWTGPLARIPTVQILHHKLSGDFHFRSEGDPKDIISEFAAFEDKELEFGRLRRSGNRLGRVRSRRFDFADTDCVGFVQYFGVSFSDGPSVGTDRVFGYYCADPGVSLSDEMVKTVLGGIGIKR